MDVKTIIEKAFEAAKNSYSPYSKFKVGACIEMRDGNYFLGTNIENAAVLVQLCAQNVMLFMVRIAMAMVKLISNSWQLWQVVMRLFHHVEHVAKY
mgnify:CR=1 FL=1